MEFGLPSTIVADYGTQYTSEHFRRECESSGIQLVFSFPYHHQANSAAERAIGTIKHLWKKATRANQSKNTALWMYRITPLDDNLPSPYELLFGRKPRTFLPSKASSFQHRDADEHLQFNQKRQQDQAKFYNTKASYDRRELYPGEKVNIYNTLKKQWEPGVIACRENPISEPRAYTVLKNGKEYRRTRQHIKPRKTCELAPPVSTPVQQIPATSSPTRINNQLSNEVTTSHDEHYSKDYITRSGRSTKVPLSYKL